MGLDISHNAWHGAYSAFNRYRTEIAKQIGIDLNKMDGFTDETDAIDWDSLKPIHYLLNHSDCDGYINWSVCAKIADELEKLLPALSELDGGGHIGNYKDKTLEMIKGLRLAHSQKEKLLFR